MSMTVSGGNSGYTILGQASSCGDQYRVTQTDDGNQYFTHTDSKGNTSITSIPEASKINCKQVNINVNCADNTASFACATGVEKTISTDGSGRVTIIVGGGQGEKEVGPLRIDGTLTDKDGNVIHFNSGNVFSIGDDGRCQLKESEQPVITEQE